MRRTLTMIRSNLAPSRGLFLGLLGAASVFLPSCDNPACVYGGTCERQGATGTSGGLGTEAASVPQDGAQLLAAAPSVVSHLPTGTTADILTPIVLTFSESMASTNLNIAFELSQQDFTGTLPFAAAVLLGDGHMVVLYPAGPLTAGKTYIVKYREMVVVADLTGQTVTKPADRVIGQFTTAMTNPTTPSVVATWPADGATGISTTSEIDVVFSRPMDPLTIADPSFVVTTGGFPPIADPVAQPVTIVTSQGSVPDTRVYRYRSLDGSGNPVPFGTLAQPLGTNADVRVDLSPAGHAIQDANHNTLANKMFGFHTATFSAPLRAEFSHGPTDAIGLDQISGPQNLALTVHLADAVDGDRLGIYLFGKEPGVALNPKTIALLREVALEAPFNAFTLTAPEVDLLKSESPVSARLADGAVNIAFYVKRGSVVSPVRLLDVDTATKGIQAPVLDTVRPTLFGLGTSGNVVSSFRSDMRGIVLVGRGSETVRAALVTTTLGTNERTPGEPPPVVGAHSSGLFVAAPVRTPGPMSVPIGVLDPTAPPVGYTIQIFDRALNSTTAVSGQFTQVGQASSGTAAPFATVTVFVVHANTLAPVVGASVTVHESLLGDVTAVAAGVTDSNGRVELMAAPDGDTIVSVDARNQGFDLFTFDGVTTDRLSIPLQPTGQLPGLAAGVLTTTDILVAGTEYTRAVSDSRFPSPGETLLVVPLCSPISTAQPTSACTFGPAPIRAREIGAESALVVLTPGSEFDYSPLTFLKAFQLALPLPPVDPGIAQATTLAITQTLDLGTLDPEARPIDVAPRMLSTSNYPPLTSSAVRVRVEATSPGQKHGVTVGRGIAFSDTPMSDTFSLRAAYPGIVDGIQDVPTDQLGTLVEQGTLDPDLLLRAELLDPAGNRAGVRPRLSTPVVPLMPPSPPAAAATPFVPSPSGLSLDLFFADVLPGSLVEPGLYRVTLQDSAGLAWTVWRLGPSDPPAGDTVVHLPRIGANGVLPLAVGPLRVRISAFAWPALDALTPGANPAGFDATRLMWSDIEREYDLFAHAAEAIITPPVTPP